MSTLPRTVDDLQAEAERAQLRGAPGRAGADPGAGGQLAQGQAVAGDEHVARVLPRRDGGEHEPVGAARSAGP